MMKFRLLSGTCVIGSEDEQKTYEGGDVISTNLNLSQMFANKFRRVGRFVEEDDVEEEKPEADQIEEGDEGEDVTDQFDLASELGLNVVRKGKGKSNYFVVDNGIVLNDEPLKKVEVVPKLKEYVPV